MKHLTIGCSDFEKLDNVFLSGTDLIELSNILFQEIDTIKKYNKDFYRIFIDCYSKVFEFVNGHTCDEFKKNGFDELDKDHLKLNLYYFLFDGIRPILNDHYIIVMLQKLGYTFSIDM